MDKQNIHNHTTITPIMLVYIVAVAPPKHQAYIRCAGSMGVSVFDEAVAQGRSALCVEYSTTTSYGDCYRHHHAPIILPIPSNIELFDSDDTVLVVSHDYIGSSTTAMTSLNIAPARRLRYIAAPDATTLSFQGMNAERALMFGAAPPFINCWEKVLSIEFIGTEDVQTFEGGLFLSDFKCLTSVDFSSFRNILLTGPYFLAGCCSLTSINLSPLRNVTNLERCFLQYCTSLESIDLSPLCAIESVGAYFLDGCESLVTIDISCLRRVTNVGSYFLRSCTALTIIEISPLSHVINIGDYFMSGCASLSEINLDLLSNVTTIGIGFLSSCTSLTTVDVSALGRSVAVIGPFFMQDCVSLTSIDITPLEHVTEVGGMFLCGCSSLAAGV